MLFKILHGDPSKISLDITPFHEGWCYVTHDGYFYVDLNVGTVETPNNQRVKLNANEAEKLTGYDIATILNSSEAEIPTSAAVFTAIEAAKSEALNASITVLAEAQQYTDTAIANIEIPEGFSGSYNDLTDKPEIPIVPTKVSAFENDKGYLTEHQSLADYAKKSELPTVPTKVSELTNDAGYLTSVPAEYVTETELNNALANVGGGATSWNDLIDKPFEETAEGIKTLDEKFISDTIARTTTVEALDGRVVTLEAIDHEAYKGADEAILTSAKEYVDTELSTAIESVKADASNKATVVLAEAQIDASNKAAVVLAEAQKGITSEKERAEGAEEAISGRIDALESELNDALANAGLGGGKLYRHTLIINISPTEDEPTFSYGNLLKEMYTRNSTTITQLSEIYTVEGAMTPVSGYVDLGDGNQYSAYMVTGEGTLAVVFAIGYDGVFQIGSATIEDYVAEI